MQRKRRFSSSSSIKEAVTGFINRNEWLQKALSGFANAFANTFRAIGDIAKNIFGGIADLIRGVFSGDTDLIKGGMSKLANALSASFAELPKAVEKGFAEAGTFRFR